jgi:hypothetical protein
MTSYTLFGKKRAKNPILYGILKILASSAKRAFWEKARQKPESLSFTKDFVKVFNKYYRSGFLARFFPKSALGFQNTRIYIHLRLCIYR